MKTRALMSFALAAGLSAVPAAVPAGWSSNFTAALAEAKAHQQPVLVYFTASWCGPCKLMARTTLTNDTVLATLTNFSRVALDIDENPVLAQQHAVQAVPTFEVLTPVGDEVARTTGYREAEAFVQWLTNSAAKLATATARRKQLDERFAALDKLLHETDDSANRKAATELFDLCAEKEDSARKTATAGLKQLVERDASLLLDGLNHPRLATRIEVANLLRSRLGESFDVDPWSDAATREKGVSSWREKLATKPAPGRTP